MEKVFICMIKRYFVQNGTDYACAIGDNETKVVSKREIAEEWRKVEIHKMETLWNGSILSKDLCYDSFGDYYKIVLRDGFRIIIQILEKDLIDNVDFE